MSEDYNFNKLLEAQKQRDLSFQYMFRLGAIAIITAGVVTVLSPVMVTLAPVFEAVIRQFFGLGFE